MREIFRVTTAAFILGLTSWSASAQSAPPASGKVWHDPSEENLSKQLSALPDTKYPFDSSKIYTLPELIDLAEQHNPETRLAWQQAKVRAASLGIARSALYPTVAAIALANTTRTRVLFNSDFFRQTYGTFSPEIHLEYLILDFGGRSGAIDAAKANLLAADLAFNDTHRRIIFQVMSAYYRLLNAIGQRAAAEVSLRNAQAVQEDAEARLNHGLATKPDVLEAQAATAQAQFDLQATIGGEEIARGDLATVMGLPPDAALQVEDISKLHMPGELADSVNIAIDRSFEQRPDLKERFARLQAADAAIKQSRSSYFPSLSLSGNGGMARQYGKQDLLPQAYASGETWDVDLALKWTLFDGARREHAIAEAKAAKAATRAEIDSLRDEIANEVWAAYSNVKTAQRQQLAAAALLVSADQSYAAARESYSYGVRNLLDVVAAQKALAQASSEDVSARAQLLLQSASLAFETGDLITVPPPKAGP
ncbi:MAG TPA: TolC family protein [Pseudacidobacterium sp.]|jgi:outer membrane protein TolC|nr:TolC family protein [Pseudacidobacterium sp.]